MKMHEVFDGVATAFEALGVLSMIIGFLIAFFLAAQRMLDGETGAFQLLRTSLGGAILLGLEILVAADLIRTVTSEPSLENVAVLGVIVLLRTILSMSIQIEIDGTLPWKRALTESGASVVSKTVTAERNRHRAATARRATAKKKPAKKAAPRTAARASARKPAKKGSPHTTVQAQAGHK
ncbi:DUF1622 domain-containing protein [Gordonia sp. (in: high G+C Gram-positive bacteria)]|uniref:DUF1622 domain-containing protein n=1 Tax=Gordonia sp. (in: high G+C Gram-positive bacteria) TaxID=84139 RepID=UPI0039E3059C